MGKGYYGVKVIEYRTYGLYKIIKGYIYYGSNSDIDFKDLSISNKAHKKRGNKYNFYLFTLELQWIGSETKCKLHTKFIIFITISKKLFK